MKWNKRGLIYNTDKPNTWTNCGAMTPTPIMLDNSTIRIFVSFCDQFGIARVGSVDVSAEDPKNILRVSSTPLVDTGRPGTFDDNGTVACSVTLTQDNTMLMHYVGFELCQKIRYRLFTGLAISNDMGTSFQKYSEVPVLDRSSTERFFRCGPYCVNDNGNYKLWYVAGNSWEDIEGKQMPVYVIKYLESQDGIKWGNCGEVCIDIENHDEHGFGRPWVIKTDGMYRMFYSVRVKKLGYRLGYAESHDGRKWTRKDNQLGFDVSHEGWDSEMICFSAIIPYKDRYYMFYNGNDFGKSGFGYAILESW
ncbi:MAG: hypothetical protein RW306_01860 [Geobacteraceae bacterium]|nr:hypothetical protein [Geobacteraceae bacterium]